MKIYIIAINITIFSLSGSIKEIPQFPQTKIINNVNGWVKKDKSWRFQNKKYFIEASDHNNDGKIDYYRLQKPLGSFNHFVWLDKDFDGTFDEVNGIKLKEKIEVPKVEETEKKKD